MIFCTPPGLYPVIYTLHCSSKFSFNYLLFRVYKYLSKEPPGVRKGRDDHFVLAIAGEHC